MDHLIDAMLEGYVGWREQCIAVTSAYDDWSCAARCNRARAFGAYLAALNREQCAAASYRCLADQVSQTARSHAGRRADDVRSTSEC